MAITNVVCKISILMSFSPYYPNLTSFAVQTCDNKVEVARDVMVMLRFFSFLFFRMEPWWFWLPFQMLLQQSWVCLLLNV